MNSKKVTSSKVALVYGMLPTIEEIDQLQLLDEQYELTIISSESIIAYISENSFFENLSCIPLQDHNENPTFLPGLDNIIKDFDIVIIKERLGIYAYQAIKAKWKYRFRLLVWIDNLTTFPCDDVQRIKTIRDEVSKVCDGFIVQTKSASETLLLEGVPKEKIMQWPCWVNMHCERSKKEKFKAMKALNLNDRDILIVFTGQIEWEEGLLDLINAFKLLKTSHSHLEHQLKLAICGIGSLANDLKQRSTSLGISNDIIYLAPNRETHLTLIQAADAVFVGGHQSRDRTDGDPFKIVSAMSYGIPILAPRTLLTEELIGKHRVDYCLGSSQSIAKSILKLIEKKHLIHNIIEKNATEVKNLHNSQRARDKMMLSLNELFKSKIEVSNFSVDQKVIEIEAKISSQQYLLAIDHIEAVFNSGVEIPHHHESNLYRLIGDCFTKMGDKEAGKNSYVKSIELDSYNAKAYIGLGTVSLTKENYDIAIIHFQRAVALAPNDEMANLGLGLSFHGLDELVEAQKWILKSLELNPDNSAAIFTLVKIAQEREEYQNAEVALVAYLKRHPHDLNMIYSLAGIYFKIGKYQDAIDSLQDIIELNPLDARAQSLIKQARKAIDKTATTSVG